MRVLHLTFVSLLLAVVQVQATTNLCNDMLELMDSSKSTRRGALNRLRNAINRACTAMDLIRHGINPLELLTVPDEETSTTRRPRRPGRNSSTSTTSSTTAPPSSSSPTSPSSIAPADVPVTSNPLEIIFKHPQVNVIFGNASHDGFAFRGNEIGSNTVQLQTRVAVDAPKHLLPGDFNVRGMKTPYPAVYEVRTAFRCGQQPHNPGVYADMSLGCKVFHLCASTDPYHNKTSFYCPDKLVFNQERLRCDYYKNVNCHESYKYFSSNEHFSKKFDIKYVVLGKVN